MLSANSTNTPVGVQQQFTDSVTVRKWLYRARASGNYFQFFRPFYHITKSKLDALFLQDLINLQSTTGAVDEEGWFLCTSKFLEDIGWTEREQELRFRSLRGLDPSGHEDKDRPAFVKTSRRGIPCYRWVFIDIESIEKALDGIQSPPKGGEGVKPPISGKSQPPIGGNLHIGTNNDEDRKTVGPAADGVSSPLKPPKSKSPPKDSASPSSTGLRPSESGLASPRIDDFGSGRGSAQPNIKSRPESNGAILAPSASHEGKEHHETKQGSSNMECLPIPVTKKWTHQDEALSIEFHDAIAVSLGQSVPYTKSKWADQLRLLRDSLREKEGDTVQFRLERVLRWHISQLGTKGCLRIFCTEMFRKRFLEVEVKMLDKGPAHHQTSVQLSKESQTILDAITSVAWPQGSDKQLPTAVEQSVRNFNEFTTKLISAQLDRRQDRYRTVVLSQLGSTVDMMVNWFKAVWKSKHDWKQWSGNMAPSVWTPQHKNFVAMVNTALGKYTGDPSDETWNALYVAVVSEERTK